MSHHRGSARRSRGGIATGMAMAVGAAIQYLWDPQEGRSRRARLTDQLSAKMRDRGAGVTAPMRGKARVARDKVRGRAQQAAQSTGGPESDRELVDKVRSEVLGDEAYRDATVNVMAVDGTVTLRGELQRPELIRGLRDQVAKVTGVQRVESYLHLPGTSPPNKAEVAQASQDAIRRLADDDLQQAPD